MSRLLPLLLVLTGCEALSDFVPRVSFDRLDVQTLSFEGTDIDFVFAVENPNPVGIGLESFSYDLNLEGSDFFDGDNPEGFQLAANDSSELSLPVSLIFAELFDTLQVTRGKDVLGFDLSGDMGFDTPAGVIDIPYSEDGDLPALRTPKFRFAGLRVPKVDLTSATIEVDLGVDNAQASTLFFDRFDYDLALAGRSVADGRVTSFAADGNTESLVTLPITVSLLSLGDVVLDAVAGNPIDLDLSATMDVDTPFGIIPLSIDETGKLSTQ